MCVVKLKIKNDEKDTTQKNWWINMANNRVGLKIYAKIPFVEFSLQKNKKTRINRVFYGNFFI